VTPGRKQTLIAGLIGFALGAATLWSFHYYYGAQYRNADPYRQMLNRFSSKLDLSADQKTQVAAILEDKRQKIAALRDEARPRFEEIRGATRAEIRQVLTAEQQQKFDAMQSDWDAPWKRRRPSGGG
jgi:hypothetical protein